MNRYLKSVLAFTLMLCLAACGTTAKLGNSTKINDGTLDVASAKSVDALEEQNVAMTHASVDIFKETYTHGENSMVSPYSLIQALGLCANGAKGETKQEMERSIGCITSEWNEWALAQNAKIQDAEEPVLGNANALWIREDDFELNDEYADAITEYYGADVYKAPFDDSTVADVNDWVTEKTKERIDKLISSIDGGCKAILLNAVTFDGNWVTPYEEEYLEEGKFTAEDGKKYDATFMESTEDRYIKGKGYTGVIKPYENGYSFVAFLPNKGVTVDEFLGTFDGHEFERALNDAEFASVKTRIPKFKNSFTVDNAVDVLENLGIKSIFDMGKADLSGIGTCGTDNLYIGEVVHKTYIDVNEKGTEAAAATGMMIRATALPGESREVNLNRPFVYAIIDDETELPLFMGTCMNFEE